MNRNKMNRKAQTEIVGLVIIVMIITIAMLFYVSYKAKPENASKKTLYQEYAYNELATSFAQSFLETYVDDCQATVEELIVDCGSLRGGRIRCGFLTSCQKLDFISEEILNKTLDQWNYPYGFVLKMSSSKNITIVKHNCTSDTVGRGTPGVFLIPYYPSPGVASLELGICKY